MLDAWRNVIGRDTVHDSADWYDSVRRLSPTTLRREVNARRGAHCRSVRVPNPVYITGGKEPRTLVR